MMHDVLRLGSKSDFNRIVPALEEIPTNSDGNEIGTENQNSHVAE